MGTSVINSPLSPSSLKSSAAIANDIRGENRVLPRGWGVVLEGVKRGRQDTTILISRGVFNIL